jgi:hypothetical protein
MEGGAYERALEEARAEFARIPPGVIAVSAGVDYEPAGDAGGTFAVSYMDGLLRVEHPSGRVEEGGAEVTVAVTIVVLHYLSRSVGPLDLSDPVRFQGLPGAGAYTAAFHQHAETPLLQRFGEEGAQYLRALRALDAAPAEGAALAHGSEDLLPHLPLGLRLGLADGAMPADCVILFPKRAGFVYHVEDLAVAGELLSARVLQVAERLAQEPEGAAVAVLATVYDPLEAEMIVAKLRSAGIAATVRHDALSVVYGLTVDGCGRSEVLVRESDLPEARAALPDDEA